MSNIYERLGVRTIINAKGTATRVSGGLMPAEVADAMREATQYCVDMTEFQARASDVIARHTGAEAGIVTSGAAAGLTLGTAACVTGLDPAKMNRLPDTRGLRDQVVVVRSQRNFYDHAVRAAGVELVEVGLPDRFAGAGVRDAEAWEIAEAIGDRTACIYYVANPRSRPGLPAVAEVAHAASVPVLVDAAAQLPPADNLRRFVREGADLVAFSGGKALLGPQGSGLLAGRRDLVAAAALQNLDQDLFFEQWRSPPGLFQGLQLRGLPQHGIGRGCKVGKEQIVGALVALERFAEEDIGGRHLACRTKLEELQGALTPSLAPLATISEHDACVEPILALKLPGATEAMALVLGLQDGDPCIHADPMSVDEGVVTLSALCLRDGESALIAKRLNELLG